MSDVNQTKYSFGEKWRHASNYQTAGIDSFDSDTLRWIATRNGFEDIRAFGSHVSRFPVFLDAGCGNGRILRLFRDVVASSTKLFGLDYASSAVARENLSGLVAGVFDADLMNSDSLKTLPRPDFIYCQEVLHHTSDPGRSFANLADILNPGGELAIYVYKKKAPIREFTDDYVRGLVSGMTHDEAMASTKDFAEFGRALSLLDVDVEVPEVKLLGIPAGRYPVQRLVYHFFVKCYWNPELSLDENNLVNFDWYHPSLCSRHTVEEVHDWFAGSDLRVVHTCVDEYGITVRGVKDGL